MSKKHHIEDLAELPEAQALEIHFDELCWSRLYFLARFGIFALLPWLISTADQPDWRVVLPLSSLILFGVYYIWRRRGLEGLRFGRWGVGFIALQALLANLATFPREDLFSPLSFVLPPIILLVFPLSLGATLLLLSLFWLPIGLLAGIFGWSAEARPGDLLGYTTYLAIVFALGRWGTRRRLRTFLESWQRARINALDRLRMREELNAARQIQLSMLPQTDPASPWLEIAGLSRPATEVGGDYYGYFDGDDDDQAVVVADVAGHGVASGLLLAGVRGCLVMLHQTPRVAATPAEVLARLNRVVRTVGGRRTFVTMVYAVFQRSTSRLRLASAGHPPTLLWRQTTGAVEEVALPSLPLGTTLTTSFPETEIAVAVGDVVVFLTDGLAEALDPQGEVFGDTGLQATLKRAATDSASAAAIRDALLAEVVRFLEMNEGQDDMTLVVVRIRSSAPNPNRPPP